MIRWRSCPCVALWNGASMWHELFLTLFADDPTWLREHMVDVISYEALTDHPTTAQDSTKGHIHMHQTKDDAKRPHSEMEMVPGVRAMILISMVPCERTE